MKLLKFTQYPKKKTFYYLINSNKTQILIIIIILYQSFAKHITCNIISRFPKLEVHMVAKKEAKRTNFSAI